MRNKKTKIPSGMTKCPACDSFVSHSEASRAAQFLNSPSTRELQEALKLANARIAQLEAELRAAK